MPADMVLRVPPPATAASDQIAVGTVDRLQVLAAALLFSTGGAAIKACSLTSWQVASFRSGVAALAVVLVLPAARRGWHLRTAPVAAAYAATMILFVLSNKLTTAASTIYLQSTAPLYILLLAPWLLDEPIRRRDWLLIIVMATGVVLTFTGDQPTAATAPQPLLGNALAALSGLSWALTILGLRWLARAGADAAEPATAVALGNLLAFAAALPLAVPVSGVRFQDWLLVVLLGVFQIAVAYLLLTRGVRRVGALEASLLLLLEPVLNPIWAWLVHGERPGGGALAGGAIIIAVTAISTLSAHRQPAGADPGGTGQE